MDGHQKSWYDNGNIQYENNYKFTEENFNRISDRIGWQREYYENGVLKNEEFYNEITNEILCKEFDEKGVIKKEWKI
jgi:antitoxin component YwqK of YwqJK toxin-antitoxin module